MRLPPGKALLASAEAKTLPLDSRRAFASQEEDMREPCFRKKESDPPVCGVHDAVLELDLGAQVLDLQ